MSANLLEQALQQRSSLLSPDTNALRLIDGDGDGLSGIFLETFADRWVVSTRSNHLPDDIRKWLTAQNHSTYWKRLDQHEKESPSHIGGPEQNEAFTATESGVRYQIDFQAGYSQGIFLDQRLNRQRVRQSSTTGDGQTKTVLNTFAYTGAFSVCAALGGATTTTLDLSQVYLDWARDNFRLNQLDPADHYFCKGDTFHWLKRFARQGRSFDGIILDPPTFSRDDKGKVFRVEKDYHRLVQLAHACLAPGGWILCCTNCRKLHPREFARMVRRGAPGCTVTPLPMPPEYTGENYLKSLWVNK
ncbi:class I SAM-dependent rRNA methyltransferase [Verrucomicrobiaceae bacterium N1E253]|uniref:Class I SAM-dependent rRNA methyltransferase n=1 Tax=Oceaniferula marina TaxID=2748318 RepID=A0A851GNP3_9BACT|nr:class I SAM-dependent methyltransferase [Oceaniferula marina]NWK55754.1 class I SAM-dependent rRNA methyltransferase [Oceaniferula marina]